MVNAVPDTNPAARARTLAVLRAVLLTAGRPVFRRGAALVAVVGIGATIVFAGNGLRAGDLVRLFHASPAARALLWAGWTLLVAPVVSPAFDAPGTRTLRSLRLPRAPLVIGLLALFGCTQAPWALLFARGGAPLEPVVAASLGVAIPCALMGTRQRARSSWTLLGALALAAWDGPPAILLFPAVALAVFSAASAWSTGLERPARSVPMIRPMPAVLALAAAHLLRLLRSECTRLALSSLVAAGGCALLSASLRNDPAEQPLRRALVLMALPLTVGAAVLAPPMLDLERRLHPWIRSLRVRASTVALAFVLALATPSTALAAGAGAVAGAAAGAKPALLGAGLAVASLASTLSIAAWARAHDRSRRRNPVVFALGVAAIVIVLTAAASAC
jgi:hypothetical protein